MTQLDNKTACITGGGSGIGQALAKQLAKQRCEVFIVGRRAEKLKETQDFAPKFIVPITADVATVEGRESIADAIGNKELHYLVHNAAVVEPLKTLDQVTLEEWRQLIAINLDAPMFLTQLLLPNLMQGSRILNISSGLAHRALAGTGAYCVSKAGLHMLYLMWNEEFSARGILAGSVQPGVVDTEMQVDLRSNKEFINQPFFQSLKTEKQLISPDSIAKSLCKMLLEMPSNEFIQKDWRVSDLSLF